MRNEISLLVWSAASGRDKNMLQFLLSSYGDVIDINIQDKVRLLLNDCFSCFICNLTDRRYSLTSSSLTW